jgi:hypothetical protein
MPLCAPQHSMQWGDLSGNVWTIPATRYQTGVDTVPPLSNAAMKLLASGLLFREISAKVPKLPGTLQEPPLPLLPFFSRRRWINELVNLLVCHLRGLRCSLGASLAHRLGSR